MDPGAWLVDVLAWAAFETWWQRNRPCPSVVNASEVDVAMMTFIRWGVPVWTWADIRDEYDRRRWAS